MDLNQPRDWHGRWAVGGGGHHHHTPGAMGKAEADKRFVENMTVDEYGNITATIPIDVAKKYARNNPYKPTSGDAPDTEYMQKLEHTLRTQGLGTDVFKNLPVIEVGESGKYAVFSDGNHRVWAADAVGMKHIRVNIITGEDDDWAKQYGVPVEAHLSGLLKRAEAPGAGGKAEAARRFGHA